MPRYELSRPNTDLAQLPEYLLERGREYAKHKSAKATQRAQASDWRIFSQWCSANGVQSLPAAPNVVAAFVIDVVEPSPESIPIRGVNDRPRRPATIRRYLATIATAHIEQELPNPTASPVVRAAWKSIVRKLGEEPEQKAPLEAKDVRAICDKLPKNMIGLRDKALFLIGFAAALRRSEIAALCVEDLEVVRGGLRLRLGGTFDGTVKRTKTNQSGKLETVVVPKSKTESYCPVRAVGQWLKASGIKSGPIFKRLLYRDSRWVFPSDKALDAGSIARIVKRGAERVGIDPDRFAGHSLRAGLVTSAAQAGTPYHEIQKTTRHKSLDTLGKYIRLDQNAGAAAKGLLD